MEAPGGCEISSAKKLAIRRLELVLVHMATNLIHNVKGALYGLPNGNVFGWLNSTVALHWKRNGESKDLKQLFGNQVSKILEKTYYIQWRHVSGQDNPEDVISRDV